MYVIVGRWTGSMGEGMSVGFDGMERATVIGSEMSRLAGGMKTLQLQHSNFGARISFEKMYHLNGTLREQFVPKQYINQTKTDEDEFLDSTIKLIENR